MDGCPCPLHGDGEESLHGDGEESDGGASEAARSMPSDARSVASCSHGDHEQAGNGIFLQPVLTPTNILDVTNGDRGGVLGGDQEGIEGTFCVQCGHCGRKMGGPVAPGPCAF